MTTDTTPPIVLTIAGSDSSAGAGIQADLKTFSALSVYGLTVITAITAQNTHGVQSIHPLPTDVVRDQLRAVLNDFDIAAIKIGMIGSHETALMLSHELSNVECPIILDPISQSTSGAGFNDGQDLLTFLGSLIPLSFLITPNIPEAEALTGFVIDSTDAMQLAGEMLLTMGAQNVLIKSGHILETQSSDMTDILVTAEQVNSFSVQTFKSKNLHGTGCTLSSAIAAMLAHGETLKEAVRIAKAYVSNAIFSARDQRIGHGNGPLEHFAHADTPYQLYRSIESSHEQA